jgi:hypothetical protein
VSDIPEVIEGAAEARGAVKADRTYLEVPQDEVPDPYRPGRPQKEFSPTLAPKLSVVWDNRPLMEAVNEAIAANDMKRVIRIFSGTRIEAKQDGPVLVRATCIPGK